MSNDSDEVTQRIHSGLSLVDELARLTASTQGRTDDLDDRIADGRLGLVRAARLFDPSVGVPFAMFAKGHIRAAMLEGVRKRSPLTRRAHEKLMAEALRSQPPLPGAQDRPASHAPQQRDRQVLLDKHIAGIATAQAEGLLTKLGLDTQGDFLAISSQTADVIAERHEQLLALERCLEAMPHDEAAIIRRHHIGEVPLTTVATQLGLTRIKARTLHRKAVERLKKELVRSLSHREQSWRPSVDGSALALADEHQPRKAQTIR